MNRRVLTDEQELAVAHEYVMGATCEYLAEKYGCSHGTIQNALHRQRVARRSRQASAATRKVLTAEVELTLAQEYGAGASLETLALKHGCSPVTVRNALIRLGIPRRPSGRSPSPVPKTKHCSSCEQELPCSAFYTEGRRSSECPECVGRKQNHKYHTDPVYRQNRIDAERRRRTGWSTGQFEIMWEVQQGLCAICRVPMRRKGWAENSVQADHDHVTGQIRSLLCGSCNRGLGCFHDSPEHLRRAAEYVERHAEYPARTGT